MALATTLVGFAISTATASNVNGGLFNTANANFFTDGVIASGTGNTPTISSVTYPFDNNDIGAKVWLPTQTNITAGFYEIASQTGGVATLKAAIGEAAILTAASGLFAPNILVAGCATTSAPTGVTFGVNYAQQAATIQGFTNLGSANGSTTVTDNSAGGLMKKSFAGNHLRITAGTNATVGWYEVVSVTDTNNVVLDRTPHGANTMSATTGKVGGAFSLGSSDDAVFELFSGGATSAGRLYIKGGATYTLGGTVSVAVTGGAWFVNYEGYTTVIGDAPVNTAMPILACGAAIFTPPTSCYLRNITFTGTANPVVAGGPSTRFVGCKVLNTSTTADQVALTIANNGYVFGCDLCSIRGTALSASSVTSLIDGNYIHDSSQGVVLASGGTYINNIFACNVTSGITTPIATGNTIISGNTFYGTESKLGIGINNITATMGGSIFNNIFYGLATGVSIFASQSQIFSDYNCYYNNTTDVTNIGKGKNDIAVNPAFTSVTERTGTTATTTSGNHLVQSGATFQTWGVTTSDFLYVASGTGPTAGIYQIASVDSETQITTTQTLTANATADKTWFIIQGRNFLPTGAI